MYQSGYTQISQALKQSRKSRQFESLKVIMMTLQLPEWVLAWALRHFLQALEYAEMLKEGRFKAKWLEKETPELERLKKEIERLEKEIPEMEGVEESLEMESQDEEH